MNRFVIASHCWIAIVISASVVLWANSAGADELKDEREKPDSSVPVQAAKAVAEVVQESVAAVAETEDQARDATAAAAEEALHAVQADLLAAAAHAGGKWFAALIDKPVDRTAPVDRWLFGTHSRGTARTTGRVTAQHLAAESSPQRAIFLLALHGRTVSTTRGVNGPATVDCVTTIPFTATCRLAFDGRRFTAGPVQFAGRASLQVRAVHARRGLFSGAIRRVATRRAAEQRGAAEQVALSEARKAITDSYTKCVGDHCVTLNERVGKIDLAKLLMPAIRGDVTVSQTAHVAEDDRPFPSY